MGSGEMTKILRMKSNKSLLKDTARYNELLQELRHDRDLRLSIENSKTSEERISKAIVKKFCKSAHHSRWDVVKITFLLSNFKCRILKDLHKSETEVPAPFVKWLHFFRSYLWSILQRNENYMQSLKIGKRIPPGVLSQSMLAIFGSSTTSKGGNAIYYKFFRTQVRNIFIENKEMLKKNKPPKILNFIDDDYESVNKYDEFNRPKRWAEYFTANEETLIRSMFNIPNVVQFQKQCNEDNGFQNDENSSSTSSLSNDVRKSTSTNPKSRVWEVTDVDGNSKPGEKVELSNPLNETSLPNQNNGITNMEKADGRRKRLRTNSSSNEDEVLENTIHKRIKLSGNGDILRERIGDDETKQLNQGSTQWNQSRFGMPSRILGWSLIGCQVL